MNAGIQSIKIDFSHLGHADVNHLCGSAPLD